MSDENVQKGITANLIVIGQFTVSGQERLDQLPPLEGYEQFG